MKKIVLFFAAMLLLMQMPLAVSAQGEVEPEEPVYFLGIDETNGTTFDFGTLKIGLSDPIELKAGQKYALVVLLNDAVGGDFSESGIKDPLLKLGHPESISSGEDAQFEVLLSGSKDGKSVFSSDKIPFTVTEDVIIQPYQYIETYTAFSNNQDGSTSFGDIAMTMGNNTVHMISLAGDEEQVVFLVEVQSQTAADDDEVPLITVEESDHEPATPYSATSVIGILVSLILVAVVLVVYRQYDKRHRK